MSFQPTRDDDRVISVEEAQRRVLLDVTTLDPEELTLSDALGRILREEVVAAADLPQGDNTAMDGYAVLAADTADASEQEPVSLDVIGDLPAGVVPVVSVRAGTAVRIMTGAMIPDGADAVVQVEQTDGGSPRVSIFAPVTKGTNVRLRGEDMRRGELVLPSGTLLGPGELGVLASAQRTRCLVGRRPVVAILSTGDELVEPGQPVPLGKIVNSNAWSLAAMVEQAGGIARRFPIVRDSREETVAAIESALACDVLLSSGGVSVGAYDFVKDALDHLGAETRFWRVAMKPGKPVVLSRLRDRIYFGLPGNPVSCLVAFILFVAPSLRKAMGQSDDRLLSPVVNVRVSSPLHSRGERRTFLRVRVVARDGALEAIPMSAQGSGVSTSMVQANGLAMMEQGVTFVDAGAMVPVVLFGAVQ
jgi:molybdopterin molybdotransferase